jgi:hypothetical protein
MLLLSAWVLLSGIGGIMWQDCWDHSFRNAVYFDLANHAWPVTETYSDGAPAMLCYYFGFWLPSAFIARLTGSIAVGYWVQLIYALIGAILTMLMIFRYVGAVKVRIVVIFALFCGWDFVAWLLLRFNPSLMSIVFSLKDLSYHSFSAPSATTQLYFIYNQGIAFWLVAMLLLRQRNNVGALILTYALLAIYSPIAAAALAPVVAYGCLRNIRGVFSVGNVGGILFGVVVAAFYMSNNRVGGFHLSHDCSFAIFLLFLLLSFGVYLPFVWRNIRRDWLFWGLFATMCVLSWCQLGDTNDLAWRCTMPTLFYLMLYIMKETVSVKSWRTPRSVALATVLAIGMIAPVGILLRSGAHQAECMLYGKSTRSEYLKTLFDRTNICYDSFVTEQDGFFTKYLMRNRDSSAYADETTAK